MVQIDFFDKDIVSTLLPVTTMEPDKVCFLIDKMQGKKYRISFARVFLPCEIIRGPFRLHTLAASFRATT